ncbi:MAG: hypothetical protein ABFD89_11410 [Bryobacteraceae bacterium]
MERWIAAFMAASEDERVAWLSGLVPLAEQTAPREVTCGHCFSTLRAWGDNVTLEVVREGVPKTGKAQLSATERALYEHIGRLSEKERPWLERLLYILRRGDEDTRAAITRNLERFELLARVLNGEFMRGETGDPSRREQPPDPRLQRIRELAERYLGGGKTGGADEGRIEQQETGNAEEPPGKRRKQR